jgi:hypothetical protein
MMSGCGKYEAATITAFGESTGRSHPEIVRYYDDAAIALDRHLKSISLFPTTKPPNASNSGVTFAAQRDTWYKGNSPGVYIKVRQPTVNAAGLDVYVRWEAKGTSAHVEDIQRKAQALQTQLTEWWEEYKRKNPMP